MEKPQELLFNTGLWAGQQLQSRIVVVSMVGRCIGSGSNPICATYQQSDCGQVSLHLCTSVCSSVKWKLQFTLIKLLSGLNEQMK